MRSFVVSSRELDRNSLHNRVIHSEIGPAWQILTMSYSVATIGRSGMRTVTGLERNSADTHEIR